MSWKIIFLKVKYKKHKNAREEKSTRSIILRANISEPLQLAGVVWSVKKNFTRKDFLFFDMKIEVNIMYFNIKKMETINYGRDV